MRNTLTALLALTILAGCDGSDAKAPTAQVGESVGGARTCVTTGPSSPIVTGKNSVVAIDGKAYAAGQSDGCAAASTNITTHGVGSPIVTGAGSKVTIHVEQ